MRVIVPETAKKRGHVEQGERKKQGGERVQTQGLQQISMEQSGEGAGGAAARAKDAEVLADGACRIEPRDTWVAQTEGSHGKQAR